MAYRRSKRAGSLAGLISQAIVPFSILGLQQTYRKNKRGGKRTRKNRSGKRSRRHH
jgi:hypothetical protein